MEGSRPSKNGPRVTEHRRQLGRRKGAHVTRDRAEFHAFKLFPLLQEQARQGCKTLAHHAEAFTQAGVLTSTGGHVWDAKRIDLILVRFESSLPRGPGSRARRLHDLMTGPSALDFSKPLTKMSEEEIEDFRRRILANDNSLKMTIRQRTAKFIEIERHSRGSSSRILKVMEYLDAVEAGKISTKIDAEHCDFIRYSAALGLIPEILVKDLKYILKEIGLNYHEAVVPHKFADATSPEPLAV